MSILQPNNATDIYGFIHKYKKFGVKCSSLTQENDEFSCLNAITPSINKHFHSGSFANQWMNVSLIKRKILLTHYSIQSPNRTEGSWWGPPISWIFRGMKENGEWIDIDNVANSGISSSLSIITRKVNDSTPFKSFSIHMYGNGYSDQTLRIYKIDFFGAIDPPLGYFKSLYCKRKNIKFEYFYLIMICT